MDPLGDLYVPGSTHLQDDTFRLTEPDCKFDLRGLDTIDAVDLGGGGVSQNVNMVPIVKGARLVQFRSPHRLDYAHHTNNLPTQTTYQCGTMHCVTTRKVRQWRQTFSRLFQHWFPTFCSCSILCCFSMSLSEVRLFMRSIT